MKTQPLGTSSLVATRLAYGNMRSVGTWNPAEVDAKRTEDAIAAHVAAYEAGYTLFDTADIYCRGECEKVLGQTLKRVSGMRERILVSTKCGIRFPGDPNPDSPQRFDFSAEHILWSCDNSLKNLGIETIDLYHLHRPDLLMNPPEIAEAFDKLKRAGKVREFAVSNFLPSFVSALQSALPFPIVANQVEIHLGRLAPFYDGTLDQCVEQGITPLSWSPLGGGYLGTERKVDMKNPRYAALTLLTQTLDKVAAELNTTRTIVSLAWLMKHPSRIVPIIGSAKPDHIRDAAKADDVELSREQWYRILVAARNEPLP